MTEKIDFIYFDIGNVIFNFQGGLEELAKITNSSLDICTTVWKSLDDDVCKGIKNPQDIWTEIKKATNFEGEDINFIEFWVSHFKPIKETHTIIASLSRSYPIGLLSN